MFKTVFQRVGVLGIGGVVWGTQVHEGKKSDFVLRPPGALEEKDFLKSCIKCGLCVTDCPYDTLKLAEPGSDSPVGTPYFVPRVIPCYMCTDIPCVEACPTDALSGSLVSDVDEKEQTNYNINKSEMGVAVIDTKNCLAYLGIRCEACYRACPLLDDALTIEYERNKRTGKHAMLKPKVNVDSCTGCGMCEHACITEKATIFILPKEKALGRLKTDYIKGWEEEDEKRIDTLNYYKDIPKTEQKTLDYLNNTDELLNE